MRKHIDLGEQLKKLRKRAGLSQMELELRINAGYGSISRIENNEVNPTKETLLKIIDQLNLPVHDAASLMGLNLNDFLKMLDVIKILNSTLDLETVLQQSINQICNQLDLVGGFLSLVKNERIYTKTCAQKWYLNTVFKAIGQPFTSLNLPLNIEGNLVAKSIRENKVHISNDLTDFTSPFVNTKTSNFIINLVKVKSCICIPVHYEKHVIGAIVTGKSYEDDFSNELPVLKAFTDHIGVAITNAQKYQTLQDELNKLKAKA